MKETALTKPFVAVAKITIEKYGDLPEGMKRVEEIDVGGFMLVYVGRAADHKGYAPELFGEMSEDETPIHPTQVLAGNFFTRDRTQLLNLSLRSISAIDSYEILEEVLETYLIAIDEEKLLIKEMEP